MNKKILKRIAVAAMAVSGIIFNGCSGPSEPASVLLKKAIGCGENAKWKQALELVEQAEEQNPKDTDIQLFHVLALENNGRTEEALTRIHQLATDNPKSFEIQYTSGRLLFAGGDYEQALVPLQNAITARPGDSNTTLLLAKTCMRLQKYKQALNLYKQLALKKEFRNQPEIYNELGVLYALTGRTDYAIIIFRDKCDKFPVSVMNYAVIQDFYTGSRPDAAALYNKYLRMTANRPELEQERILVTQRLEEIR